MQSFITHNIETHFRRQVKTHLLYRQRPYKKSGVILKYGIYT